MIVQGLAKVTEALPISPFPSTSSLYSGARPAFLASPKIWVADCIPWLAPNCAPPNTISKVFLGISIILPGVWGPQAKTPRKYRYGLFSFSCLWEMLYYAAQAAITKTPQTAGAVNNRHVSSLRSRCRQHPCLMRTPFLVHRWHLLTVSSGRKGWGSFLGSLL